MYRPGLWETLSFQLFDIVATGKNFIFVSQYYFKILILFL